MRNSTTQREAGFEPRLQRNNNEATTVVAMISRVRTITAPVMYLLNNFRTGSHIATLTLNVERLWLNISTGDDQ